MLLWNGFLSHTDPMEYNNLQVRNPLKQYRSEDYRPIKTWRCGLNKEVDKECRQPRPICKRDKNHSTDRTKCLHLVEIKACLHHSPSLQPPSCSCIFSTLSLCPTNKNFMVQVRPVWQAFEWTHRVRRTRACWCFVVWGGTGRQNKLKPQWRCFWPWSQRPSILGWFSLRYVLFY